VSELAERPRALRLDADRLGFSGGLVSCRVKPREHSGDLLTRNRIRQRAVFGVALPFDPFPGPERRAVRLRMRVAGRDEPRRADPTLDLTLSVQ
jgi:hypothetical protein